MTNFVPFQQSGNTNPFDALKSYTDRLFLKFLNLVGLIRSGASAPTASDIADGKYAFWYNTTDTTVKIYYNKGGAISQVATGGGGGVTSFNTRTGAVVPTTGDYTFAQIGSTPTTLSGYGITDGVRSVSLTAPSILSVSGSPVIGTGTIGLTLTSQTANTILAAPDGSTGAPTFRALVQNDIPSSQTLGSLYNKSSWANLSDFTLTGSPTVSVSSNKINVSGGNQTPSATVGTANSAFNQVINISAYGNSMLERWKMTGQFQVNVTPASGTTGFGIGTYSTNILSALNNLVGYFNMSTGTGTGTVSIITSTNNTTAAISVTALTFSNGDTIELSIERILDTVFVAARNITTGSAQVTCNYTYDTSLSANLNVPNVGQYAVVNFGGAYIINSLSVQSNAMINSNVMFVGDSKLAGYSTPFSYRIAALVSKVYKDVIVSAGPSDTTDSVLKHISEIIALKPKQIILCIGRNDVAFGVATGTWQANLSSIVSQLQTAGITVTILDAIYETNNTQAALLSYVHSTFPTIYIGSYAIGAATTAAVSTDGIHPSYAGVQVVLNAIKDSPLVVDKGFYQEDRSTNILGLNQAFSSVTVFGTINTLTTATNGLGPYLPSTTNKGDILMNAGNAIAAAYGSGTQMNRLVLANAGNAVMEFRSYTGGNPTNASFTWFNPVGGATGTQSSAMSLTQDAFLTIGSGPRTFTSASGDISVFQGKAYRGGSATTAGNEGAFVPFASSTGATEIRNYLSSGTVKIFTSNGVNGTQLESVDVFANGNVGIGQTTDLTTGKLQVNGIITALGLKPKTSVSSAASLTLTTAAVVWVFSGSSATTWTLPAVSGNTDLYYVIKNRGSATITLQRAGSDNLYTNTTATSIVINPGEAYELSNDGTYWLVL